MVAKEGCEIDTYAYHSKRAATNTYGKLGATINIEYLETGRVMVALFLRQFIGKTAHHTYEATEKITPSRSGIYFSCNKRDISI
jgi:hypothetical protein